MNPKKNSYAFQPACLCLGVQTCHCVLNICCKVQSSNIRSWHINSGLFFTWKFVIGNRQRRSQSVSLVSTAPPVWSDSLSCVRLPRPCRRPWFEKNEGTEDAWERTGVMNEGDRRRRIYKRFHFLPVSVPLSHAPSVVPRAPSHARFFPSPPPWKPCKVLRNRHCGWGEGEAARGEEVLQQAAGRVTHCRLTSADTSSPRCRNMTQCKAALRSQTLVRASGFFCVIAISAKHIHSSWMEVCGAIKLMATDLDIGHA